MNIPNSDPQGQVQFILDLVGGRNPEFTKVYTKFNGNDNVGFYFRAAKAVAKAFLAGDTAEVAKQAGYALANEKPAIVANAFDTDLIRALSLVSPMVQNLAGLSEPFLWENKEESERISKEPWFATVPAFSQESLTTIAEKLKGGSKLTTEQGAAVLLNKQLADLTTLVKFKFTKTSTESNSSNYSGTGADLARDVENIRKALAPLQEQQQVQAADGDPRELANFLVDYFSKDEPLTWWWTVGATGIGVYARAVLATAKAFVAQNWAEVRNQAQQALASVPGVLAQSEEYRKVTDIMSPMVKNLSNAGQAAQKGVKLPVPPAAVGTALLSSADLQELNADAAAAVAGTPQQQAKFILSIFADASNAGAWQKSTGALGVYAIAAQAAAQAFLAQNFPETVKQVGIAQAAASAAGGVHNDVLKVTTILAPMLDKFAYVANTAPFAGPPAQGNPPVQEPVVPEEEKILGMKPRDAYIAGGVVAALALILILRK